MSYGQKKPNRSGPRLVRERGDSIAEPLRNGGLSVSSGGKVMRRRASVHDAAEKMGVKGPAHARGALAR